jgi:NADH:ubiquinone oxidoreductase subunit F (NADH-binding)
MKAPYRASGTQSFYHLEETIPAETACHGAACFVARHQDPERWQAAQTGNTRVYCMGKCYRAPASEADTERPHVEVRAPVSVLLNNLVEGGARSLDEYLKRGGYRALERATTSRPEEIVTLVEASQLRGRGGAGFPTGRKMRAVWRHATGPKYVIANADEGDPGSYADRFLMEDDPFGLVEAMTLAGYAVGAEEGVIYLRREYSRASDILEHALDEARAGGFLGDRVLRRDFTFDIRVSRGHGSYVCGEETALIRSLEGKRPEVMPRPPFPTDAGYAGKPTLLLNVETLCNLPWIVQHGAEAYRALGYADSRGTKALSLNSLFRRPGIYEVEFGTPLRTIVEDMGGGLRTGPLVGVMLAGPLGSIVPASLLDVPLDFEALRRIGANLGHGGLVAFDSQTSLPQLVHHVFEFAAHESCGKCPPCRVGSSRVERSLRHALADETGPRVDRQEWTSIVGALSHTSLCGLGVGLAEMAESAARNFPGELDACMR